MIHTAPATARNLVTLAAHAAGMRGADLIGVVRTARVTLARHLAMLLVREATAMSYPSIGRLFGFRDHATVIAGIRRARFLLSVADPTATALMAKMREATADVRAMLPAEDDDLDAWERRLAVARDAQADALAAWRKTRCLVRRAEREVSRRRAAEVVTA